VSLSARKAHDPETRFPTRTSRTATTARTIPWPTNCCGASRDAKQCTRRSVGYHCLRLATLGAINEKDLRDYFYQFGNFAASPSSQTELRIVRLRPDRRQRRAIEKSFNKLPSRPAADCSMGQSQSRNVLLPVATTNRAQTSCASARPAPPDYSTETIGVRLRSTHPQLAPPSLPRRRGRRPARSPASIIHRKTRVAWVRRIKLPSFNRD